MGTTVWVDDQTRLQLRELQRSIGADSVNATIQHLMARPAQTARQLFAQHRKEIQQILRKHGATDLIAFGSRARGDAQATSDLDLAARFAKNANPLALLAIENDLEDLLGIKVRMVERSHPSLQTTFTNEGVSFDA